MADKEEKKENPKVDVEGNANGGVTIKLNKTALTALITAIAGFVFNYYTTTVNRDENRETNKGAYEYTQARLDRLERQVETLMKAVIEGKAPKAADKVGERKPASTAPSSLTMGTGEASATKASAPAPKYDDFVKAVQQKGTANIEDVLKAKEKERTDDATK